MGLLNLTLAELLTILVPLSAALVTLYLYHRVRRRRIVSTLRFWPRTAAPAKATLRRKLQQPLSLLLQLLALLCLLLAIADPFIGGDQESRRHHVLILETSAWMNASEGAGTLMDQVRSRAFAYLEAIPPGDPVLLIHAAAVPTPVTGFTTDRQELERAVRQAEPGWTATNLAAAFDLAASSLTLAAAPGGDGGAAVVGEVAFVGSGRIMPSEDQPLRTSGIRFPRFIEVGRETSNTGIRRLSASTDPEDPARWLVSAEIHNYGGQPWAGRAGFTFAERSIGGREVVLQPNSSERITFSLRSQQGGMLQASVAAGDNLSADDAASLLLPAPRLSRVAIYSDQPDRLRPLLGAARRVLPAFYPRRDHGGAQDEPALVVFDGFVPAQPAAGVFLDPPAGRSPVPVAGVVRQSRILRWAPAHPVAHGIHSRDVILPQASIFAPLPGDEIVAETEEGPVIVARSDASGKSVFLGFDPAEVRLEDTLAIPLLVANVIRWFVPDAFRGGEVEAISPGLVETLVAADRRADIEITATENDGLPWSLTEGRLRFFAAKPGTVRVRTPARQSDFSLTLPELGSVLWEPPADVLRGVPAPGSGALAGPSRIWPWLALAGLFLLALDWHLYGRRIEEAVPEHARPAVPAGAGPANRPPGAGIFAARERQVTR